MNIYTSHKSGKPSYTTPACSYCRKTGHNKSNCPHALEDWEQGWKEHKVPLTTTKTNCSWFKSPRYWGEWFLKCRDLVQEQKHRRENPKPKPAKRSLKDIHCGFCGDRGHTRRNCVEKHEFLNDAYAANAIWREKAYNYLVNQKGIAVGAIVKLLEHQGYNKGYTESIGTIVSINWDELTLGASEPMYHGWNNGDYRSSLDIEVLVKGEIKTISQRQKMYGQSTAVGEKITDNHIFANDSLSQRYNSPIFNGVLSRASTNPATAKPTAEFVSASKEAFDFIARKRSRAKLEEFRVIHTINKWLP